MNRSSFLRSSLLPALVLVGAATCAIEREDGPDGGIHPHEFANPAADVFHGKFLRANTFPLADCRQCHGDDYAGGVVGTSCLTSGCHSNPKGVEWCGTCHEGGNAPPKPITGSHSAHAEISACEDCHKVPTSARENKHPNGKVEVALSGLATFGPNALPVWDAAERRCTNTYCHGATSPVWESPQVALECNACHGAPPTSHERFEVSVGTAPEGCATCHPVPGDGKHINTKIDFVEPSCNACHGTTPEGAPPRALDGATAATARGVGAHKRHLDDTLLDRSGRTVDCKTCHEVPASMRAEGHLDDSTPADVHILGASYDAVTGSCVVGCHWDKDPGPTWTDISGAPRACDGCHGYPPDKTRTGNVHPIVEASIDVCRDCHHFEISTHVDGHVDFLP